MKRINIAYWIVTGLFSAFMIFSSYDNALMGEQSVKFLHDYMGYPTYFIPWIGWAKILGALALVLPVPARVKEWAYFGLFIDLLTALYSFIALRSPEPGGYVFMSLFIVVNIASYVLYHKRLTAQH